MAQSPPFSIAVQTAGPTQGPPFSSTSSYQYANQGPPFSVVSPTINPSQSPPFGLSRTFIGTGIRGEQVQAGTLSSQHIASRSLNSGSIALSALGPDVLASGAVTNAKIASGAVTSSKLQASAVSADYIQDSAVTSAKIATNAVTTDKIPVSTIATAQIQDDAITPAKLDRLYQEALGSLSKDATAFADITAFNATTPVEVNDEDAASFPNNSSTGLRVSFEVPAHIDVSKATTVRLRISPSTAEAAVFRLSYQYRKNGGALTTEIQDSVTPSATADEQTLVTLMTFAAGQLQPGDGLVILIRRYGSDGQDTHTGAMRLFRVVLQYGV